MIKHIILLGVITLAVLAEFQSLNESISQAMDFGENKLLSRRKRYLIFPDGSSFQLVFCAQNHGYLQIGNIVWFGTTAALAWELPSDPSHFGFLKSQLRDPFIRRQDTNKHIYYLDEGGKVVAKVPYKKKPIVNPAFAKRSIQNNEDENIIIKKQVFIRKMHESQKSRSYLHKLDGASAYFHRTGRHSLYKKLETLFEALGHSGRECVLRMLCEVGKTKGTRTEQGTFLEEIFRATFTLPKGAEFEDSLEYDQAHKEKDCVKMYPECQELAKQLI